MKNRSIVLMLILVVFCGVFLTPRKPVKASANTGTSVIAMEVSTNRVLTGTAIHEKRYMASTTKILTAIVIIENCNLDEIVTVTQKTVGVEGSSIYLKAGEKISVRHLLYGLMLRSGNDCAETLAVHCSGSISAFADLMNKTAEKIGATESNFVNPHGLHDDNHYTTAYDLALISCYALKNEEFAKIVSTKKITVPKSTQDYDRVLINKNKMLSLYDGANGIKTGYTKKAGRCLVSSAKRNGMQVVTVVLNYGAMWDKSCELLDYTFDNFSLKKVIESDHILDFASIDSESVEKCGLVTDKDIILPLTKKEFENLKIECEYPKILKKPFEKGQKVGQIKIYALNNLIFSQEIYTIIGMN